MKTTLIKAKIIEYNFSVLILKSFWKTCRLMVEKIDFKVKREPLRALLPPFSSSDDTVSSKLTSFLLESISPILVKDSVSGRRSTWGILICQGLAVK